MKNQQLKIFSVYINEIMFNNFFNLNSSLFTHEIHGIDNRKDNLSLSVIYNGIINNYLNENIWLFFVHEDFEITGSLEHIFELDPLAIYGTFGVKMLNNVPIGFGKHKCSNKDGSNSVEVGLDINIFEDVQSLDCQSILIHTSLLRSYPDIRFDENLSFDLYAEDLCIKAGCVHNLPVRVIPLNFQHYSHGKITERYHSGLKYLGEKYPNYGVPGSCSFIGGLASELSTQFQYDIQAGK